MLLLGAGDMRRLLLGEEFIEQQLAAVDKPRSVEIGAPELLQLSCLQVASFFKL